MVLFALQPPANGYNTYDTRDGPYNHGYMPDYRRNPNDIYGTYPRLDRQHYDPRYNHGSISLTMIQGITMVLFL